MTKIKVGMQVAFNTLPDAVWFDVLEVNGMQIVIREAGTDYREQYSDISLPAQVRTPK